MEKLVQENKEGEKMSPFGVVKLDSNEAKIRCNSCGTEQVINLMRVMWSTKPTLCSSCNKELKTMSMEIETEGSKIQSTE